MAGTITKKQIQMIKSVSGKHMDDSEYREMLEGRFGVSSCTKMDSKQASELIDLMASWGWFTPVPRKRQRRATRPKPGGGLVVLASRDELEKIDALAGLIEWRVEDGMSRWMKARFGFERVKTSKEAYLAIEGLKGMFENRMKKLHGPGWMMRHYEDAGIRRYIREHHSS